MAAAAGRGGGAGRRGQRVRLEHAWKRRAARWQRRLLRRGRRITSVVAVGRVQGAVLQQQQRGRWRRVSLLRTPTTRGCLCVFQSSRTLVHASVSRAPLTAAVAARTARC